MPWYILLIIFVFGLYLAISNIEKLQELRSRTNDSGIKIDYVLNKEKAEIQYCERLAILGLALVAIGAWPVIKFVLLLIFV